jgi:hypothetical protein
VNLRGGDWAADFPISSKASWLAWLRSGLLNRRVQRIAVAAVAAVTIVTAVLLEVRNSWIESGVFREADRHLSYRLAEGKSASIHYPGDGPYDWTLGYARIPAFLPRLEANGYRIEAQAHSSELLASFSGMGLYPVYQQKDQAGLRIVDRAGRDMYSFDRPKRI